MAAVGDMPRPLLQALSRVTVFRPSGLLATFLSSGDDPGPALPHRGLQPPELLSRGHLALILRILKDEVAATDVDSDSDKEILLGAECLDLSVSLDKEPEGRGLTKPEADHLEVPDPELLLGEVEVGPGHQATERHAEIKVQLLPGVY